MTDQEQSPKGKIFGSKFKDDGKVKELEAKCQEYLNGWKRSLADYENLKKEGEHKLNHLREFIQSETILKILPVYDHFKLAASHIPKANQDEEWIKGIKHIQREFEDLLKGLGVEEIKSVGQKFDHAVHEAVGTEASEAEEDTVVRQIKSGYSRNGEVIRPAQVIVSQNNKENNNDNPSEK